VCGVFPDAGKPSHLLDFPWEVSVMSIHNRFCCGVEISRASVVAKALPCPKHLVFGSPCERGEIGKPAEPPVIIWDYGSDLRLLEHELGNEDCVRMADPAPGEIAAVPAIPADKRAAKNGKILWRCHGFGSERPTPNAERPIPNSELSIGR
jgi:hypothetical protein